MGNMAVMLLAYDLVYTLISVTIKVTILLTLAATAAALSRRASASFRHLVWVAGLGLSMLLPILSWNLPHWRVPVTISVTHGRPVSDDARTVVTAIPPAPTVLTTDPHQPVISEKASPAPAPTASEAAVGATGRSVPPTISPVLRVQWFIWTLLFWAGGAAFVLARLAQSLTALAQVERTSVPVPVGPIAEAAGAAAKAVSVGRPVALRKASSPERVTVPLTYGSLRPVIVLPTDAQGWPKERLCAALLHEMGHVRRNDWAVLMIGRFTCALYWFHPLAWYAERKMRAEGEAACDDLVLCAGVPATEYARHLLDVVMGVRHSRRGGWGAVAMAHSPKVEGRLRAVLAQSLSRRAVTVRTAVGLFVTALFLTLPIATIRVSAQREAVPAAGRLQLQGDFTLRYEVTITDLRSRQPLYAEYTQMRDQYQQLLKKYPHFQPVPEEARRSFAYFLSRRPRTRHLLMTVSARDGHLLFRSAEGDDTLTWVYDGRSSSLNRNGHTGQVDPGLMFGPDFALPAVGLPHLPLIKSATLLDSSGSQQTWMVQSPLMGAVGPQGATSYFSATAHAITDGGTWKLLDIDDGNQRLRYLRHQRFNGLWLASQMTTTRYTPSASAPPAFYSPAVVSEWIEKYRTATSLSQYRLLSASGVPLGLVDFDKPAVERRAITSAYAAGIRRDILHWPETWRVDPESVHSITQVQQLHVHDHTAQAVVLEDDHATVTDPSTGQRHSIACSATFYDFWRLTGSGGDVSKGWVMEKGRAQGRKNTVDGKAMP